MYTPDSHVDNAPNARLGDRVRVGELSLGPLTRSVGDPDLSHLAPGQLGTTVIRSARGVFGMGIFTIPRPLCSPALTCTVPHIVGRCPKEQMRGVHTGANVTSVANQHPLGNGTVGEFIGESMSQPHFPVEIGMAIAVRVRYTCPQPAIRLNIRFGMFPEVCGSTPLGNPTACRTTEPTVATPYLPKLNGESFAADFTVSYHSPSKRECPAGRRAVTEATRFEPLGHMKTLAIGRSPQLRVL